MTFTFFCRRLTCSCSARPSWRNRGSAVRAAAISAIVLVALPFRVMAEAPPLAATESAQTTTLPAAGQPKAGQSHAGQSHAGQSHAGQTRTGEAGDSPTQAPQLALRRYVDRTEAAYGWTLNETASIGEGKVYRLQLTSQTWQGADWKHLLYVYEPAVVLFPEQAVLFVAGGSNLDPPNFEEQLLALGLANLCGGRVALLKHVPNQPLLGNRKEDDLISETWLRYLNSGDETWPLLFPMVKSAVKAIDAVQELGEQQAWEKPVKRFVITGASKRGWTSWLTPTVEPRIAATAPLVIDMLNFRTQMRYQIETWGKPSEQIADYTRKGLVRVDGPESMREEALRTMMDPFTYRASLTLPKLAINATNDPYWAVDAAQHYWPELPGPRAVLEIPNVGHSLGSGLPTAVNGVAALFRATARGETLPQLNWSFEEHNGVRRIHVSSDQPALSARLWTATSPTADFRKSVWNESTIPGAGREFAITLPALPATATEPLQQANYCELKFIDRRSAPTLNYSITTIVKRWENQAK